MDNNIIIEEKIKEPVEINNEKQVIKENDTITIIETNENFFSPGDSNYVHRQDSASGTWTVTHNLGKKPSVMIVDSADNVVYGDIQYLSNNQLVIRFSGSFSGKAYIN